MKKGNKITYKKWDYKIVGVFGDIIHVRALNGSGNRVRMFSPVLSLRYQNGELTELNNPFNKN